MASPSVAANAYASLARIIGSGGGGASTIIQTTPSAGLTINPGLTGVTRSGSRKKYATHPASANAIKPSGSATAVRMKASSTAPATNGQPAR